MYACNFFYMTSGTVTELYSTVQYLFVLRKLSITPNAIFLKKNFIPALPKILLIR
jgi:hypothetical protein